jgi:hypothetical protein
MHSYGGRPPEEEAHMAEKINDALLYNPYHILWDPIGPPWERELDQAGQQQLLLVRLTLLKDTLAAQAKAVESAMALVAKSR